MLSVKKDRRVTVYLYIFLQSKISNNEIDLLIFLQDPANKKRTPDFYNVLNLCDQYNIPCATNLPTAEVLILALDRGDLDWRNMYK